MRKCYILNGCRVEVMMEPGLVRITNDLLFKRALNRQPGMAQALFDVLQTDYCSLFDRPLAISDDSFRVELWGHVYAEYILLKYRRIARFVLLFGSYRRLRQSCEVIDCGERGKDPNRRLWDRLVLFRNWLSRRLAKIDLLRFTQQAVQG